MNITMQNYLRKKSLRIPQYDYSLEGLYFITICIHERECILGDIIDGEMIINDVGGIIDTWWQKITERFKNIELDEYIIMPNHMHGIIAITGNPPMIPHAQPAMIHGGLIHNDNDNEHRFKNNGRGNRAPTLGKIIAYFKYQSTKHINVLRGTPGKHLWQRNYYEHIVRNDKELKYIGEYITNNPIDWKFDRNNPVCIAKGGPYEKDIF